MITLTKVQVISVHSALIATTGGSDGIRDDGLLESALNAPFQTFGGSVDYICSYADYFRAKYYSVCNALF